MSPLARLFALPVRAYRLFLSPWIGHGCRFQPSCSAYSLEALARHGGLKGAWLTCHRLCRCHPWGGAGYDPVPGADPAHEALMRNGGAENGSPGKAPGPSGKNGEPG